MQADRVELTSSKGFWVLMGFLFAIGAMTAHLAVEITKDYGGTLSDIPNYMYFPLVLVVVDITRRISFFVGHRDDKLIIEKDVLVLVRGGVTTHFSPDKLQKLHKNPGAGFIHIQSFGGVEHRIQPWLFGLFMWQLMDMIESKGFKRIKRS